jgi:hypothetical protein
MDQDEFIRTHLSRASHSSGLLVAEIGCKIRTLSRRLLVYEPSPDLYLLAIGFRHSRRNFSIVDGIFRPPRRQIIPKSPVRYGLALTCMVVNPSGSRSRGDQVVKTTARGILVADHQIERNALPNKSFFVCHQSSSLPDKAERLWRCTMRQLPIAG